MTHPPIRMRRKSGGLALALFGLATLCLACTTPSGRMSAASSADAENDPISIAVVPFGLASGSPLPPCDVAEIIRGDLAGLSRIETVALDELPDRPTRLAEVEFETWRSSGADYLVVGLVAWVHDGGHEVEFRLIDPRTETTLVGYLMPSAPDALHETAHRIAELIAQRIGEPAGITDVGRKDATRTDRSAMRPGTGSSNPHRMGRASS